MKRSANALLRGLLLATLIYIIYAPNLAGSCAVSIQPQPLVLFSYDWFDSYYDSYVYTQPGTGLLYVTSAVPDCVQLNWYGTEEYPTTVDSWLVHPYFTRLGYRDSNSFPVRNDPMPWYPWFATSLFFVQGWDFGQSMPFAGEGVITLTVFKVYY